MADKERRFSPLVLAGDALLLLCALMGLTGSFLSLYGSPEAAAADATALDRCAADGDLFLMYAALFALIALAVFSLPKLWGWAAGALAALWVGIVALCWTETVQGAGTVVRLISIQFARRVDWGAVFEYDPGLSLLEERAAVRLFLTLALAGLALLLGWTIVRARCWWLALEFTLPFLLPGLLADFYPDWLWFMALAACWCVMLTTSLCKWAAPSGRGRLTMAVFPIVAAVLAVITLAFPREGYRRPAWALKANDNLMNLTSRMEGFFSRWDGPFQTTVTYVGAAEEADLAHAGPLGYSGRTVLRVTSDYDGRLYLRGSSLAVYEDGVWKALPEGTYEEYSSGGTSAVCPLYFPAMGSGDGPAYTITVDNVGAVGACVYAPYFPLPEAAEDTGALPVEDAYLARRQGQWVNTLSFVEREAPVLPVGEVTPGGDVVVRYTDGEEVHYGSFGSGSSTAQYAGYVYAHYLDVPEELRPNLEAVASEIMAEGLAADGPVALAEAAARYLDAWCEYDVEAPAAPAGYDPVMYFLFVSHRGYCMHYASAAALLLRTMGVPARYVSGFTVDNYPNRQVTVPDRAAHAWVEVWVDGFGWYPVEVTPAAAFEWYEQGATAVDDPAIETPEPTPVPTPTPQPTEAPSPSATVPGSGDGPDGPEQGGDSLDLTALFEALKWIGAALGAAFLLWLTQFAAKRVRARRMAGPDANRAALVCYGYLRRIERWGGKMDDRAVELAQKARFSQHTLTEEELTLLRWLVDRERTRICVAPELPRRLAFRCLWGMPKAPGPLTDEVPPDSGPQT